ncbi:hypothetical protein CBR_g48304 [Chara braunii]|uniref:Uncharacterized protein n=1 Tax=Chara braunii TaxID=69332 RepID=A0A388K494_CHABU|nr:hypothetical protein CBR_g48304 [Chara braunii]|eukprot:GBG64836.1 hypothetical protein CBR_g48304 [Chara braunii]
MVLLADTERHESVCGSSEAMEMEIAKICAKSTAERRRRRGAAHLLVKTLGGEDVQWQLNQIRTEVVRTGRTWGGGGGGGGGGKGRAGGGGTGLAVEHN